MADTFEELMRAIEKGRVQELIMWQVLADLPDITEARRQYAEALGKSADALTEAEKKQAFMNAVLEQGGEDER